MSGRDWPPQTGPTTIRLQQPAPWWATTPRGVPGWTMTTASSSGPRHWDGDAPTELITPIRLDDTGPLPAILAPVVDQRPPPRAPRDRSGTGGPRLLVQFLALVVLAGLAFVAGQISTRAGAVPPPPMPAAAAEVITAGQMARIWPRVELADVRAQCDPWRRGAWREYVTDRWVQHLQSPAGGGIDVDRATVARFLNRACARRL